LREIIAPGLDGLGRGFVISKVRVMSSVFGTALFVCISLGSSESRDVFCCVFSLPDMIYFDGNLD
jgi:hypothetical protein